MPASVRYSVRSSAIFLVSVVTRARSPRSARSRISPSRSSIWLVVGPDVDLGVDEAGRADDLLDDVLGRAPLEVARRGRDEDQLADPLEELGQLQRPVVERRRQPEAGVDQRQLARAVALVHAAELAHRVVRLVDEAEEVVGEEVEQRVGRLARARGRRGCASSSRCPSRSRARGSSPCRTRCAGAGGGPRPACPRPRSPRSCSSSSARISRIARSIVSGGVM